MDVLRASKDQIERFVTALFCYADEDSYVSLRSFHQQDRGKPALLIEGVQIADVHGVIERAAQAIELSANGTEPAVFAPPVATFSDPRRATTADLRNGIALSVEADAKPAVALSTLQSLLGSATIVVHSGSEWLDPETGELQPKAHLHWRLSEPTRSAEDHEKLRQARWLAAQLVGADPTAAPPVHPLRWPGSWNTKSKPRLASIAACNTDAEIHLEEALQALAEAVEAAGLGADQRNVQRLPGRPQAPIADLAEAMSFIPNTDLHWDEWNYLGMAMWRASGGSEEGRAIWSDWSAKSGKHDEATCAGRWAHFSISPPGKIGAGTIFFTASKYGYSRIKEPPPPTSEDDYGEPRTAVDAQRQEVPANTGVTFPATPLCDLDLDDIPPREWIYGREILRGFVSVLGGIGGVGKTALAMTVCLAVVTGRPLLAANERVPPHDKQVFVKGNAWIYVIEDPEVELKRRIKAALIHYRIDKAGIGERLFIDSGRERPLVIVQKDRDGNLIALPVVDALVAELQRREIALFVVDPMLRTHRAEENSNEDMDFVMSQWALVAHRANCGVWLLHHFRKGGQGGDADAFRGAAAIQGGARVMSSLSAMSEKDAEKTGTDPELRRRYVRLDTVKENMTAPAERADWYQLVSVRLGNGTPAYPDGDSVQAVASWEPPSVWQGVGWGAISKVLHKINEGPSPGEYYAYSKQSKARWAGHLLVAIGKTETQATAMLKTWKENGVLEVGQYASQAQNGGLTGCVTVNPEKASEMLKSAPSEDAEDA